MLKGYLRLSIRLEESYMELLSDLAKQEQKSISSLAEELIIEALERREDIVLSDLAEACDFEKAKKIKHKDAWK